MFNYALDIPLKIFQSHLKFNMFSLPTSNCWLFAYSNISRTWSYQRIFSVTLCIFQVVNFAYKNTFLICLLISVSICYCLISNHYCLTSEPKHEILKFLTLSLPFQCILLKQNFPKQKSCYPPTENFSVVSPCLHRKKFKILTISPQSPETI